MGAGGAGRWAVGASPRVPCTQTAVCSTGSRSPPSPLSASRARRGRAATPAGHRHTAGWSADTSPRSRLGLASRSRARRRRRARRGARGPRATPNAPNPAARRPRARAPGPVGCRRGRHRAPTHAEPRATTTPRGGKAGGEKRRLAGRTHPRPVVPTVVTSDSHETRNNVLASASEGTAAQRVVKRVRADSVLHGVLALRAGRAG